MNLTLNMQLVAAVAVFLALSGQVTAFWRMPCKGRTGLARIDPLVDFGIAADHIHAIHGSNGFSTTATTDDLIKGDCTSCEASQDMSAYWHPALYFKKANGEFQVVQQVGGMLAYYLLEPKDAKLTAFPKGFEMLAGDTYQRNFTYPVPDVEKSAWTGEFTEQKFLRQWALGFNCLNYKAAAEPALYRHFLPEKSYLDAHCTEGVRIELMFPSCWDGKNLDGVNHDKKSHVAYPNLGNAGTCPEGFPVRLISLFYETIWNTYEFLGQDGTFVLANGDPTGYGYHGDFITGWDEAFLQKAADECKNESGQVSDCHLFNLQSEEKMNSCKLPSAGGVLAAVFKEKVSDSIDALPGNVQIKPGPAYAKGDTEASSIVAPVDVPTLSHSDAPTIAPSDAYIPAAVVKETKVSVKSAKSSSVPVASKADINIAVAAVSSAAPVTTPAPVLSDTGKPKSYFSTEYKTNGREVVEVLWVETIVTVTAEATTTTTIVNKREMTKREFNRKRHAHKHRRAHA